MDAAPYVALAHRIFTRALDEEELPAAVTSLPPLTEDILVSLAEKAAVRAPEAPRYGWAILAVADAAARRQDNAWHQGQAAWHLARAANRWIQPGRARAAARRAHAIFENLAEPGWVAASTWQIYALPWAHPNFPEVVAQLEGALAGLEAAGWEELCPYCRRDLGYAYLLVQEPETGLAALVESERVFRERRNFHEVGRTLIFKANAYRRLGRFDEALETVAEALSTLAEATESFDFQFARFRQASIQTLRGVAYDQAEATLLSVADWFREADIPLMEGQAYSLLDRLYRDTGRLRAATSVLQKAREIYIRFDVLGMQADSFVNSGRGAFLQGEYARALDHYERAQERYTRLQIPYMVAVSLMYRGEAYGGLGRYQQALAMLEEAHAHFGELGDDYRRTECALTLAGIWLALDQPDEALAHLEPATQALRAAGRTFFLTELYAAQAEAQFRQDKQEEALALLQEAATRLPAGPPLGRARIQQLQGEILCALGRPAEALPILEATLAQKREMGLLFSAAATQVTLGECYAQLGRPAEAVAAWDAALTASRGAEPEIAWRAHTGLARLAPDPAGRLDAYREAVAALTRLRRWFWQPNVAGAYLHQPLGLLDEAVALAAGMAAPKQTLALIEAGKAQTLLRQVELAEAAPTAMAVADPPRELVAEIRWLRRQIEASVSEHPGFFRPAGERRLRTRLREQLEAYERAIAPLQRRRVGPVAEAVEPPPGDFDVDGWRRRAQTALGAAWVALDFYLAGDTLYSVLLTPDTCRLFTRALDPFAGRILAQWVRGRPPAQAAPADDLERLGRWLFPAELTALLTPETRLILVPHGALHHLPWPALSLEGGGPLAAAAVPLIAPSLAAVEKLWQREPRQAPRRDGLLLAVSAFAEGRHKPLPQVRVEVEALAGLMGAGGACLLEDDATWAALQATARESGGLSSFAFWHIATHAFHDALAGRLSGIALYDRDLWLDDLWQLAPLPSLVMLSACNGSRGHFFPGDEQTGLASTALAAGAGQVVGSLWPVLDSAAAMLTASFYRHYAGGASPGHALALAQREAIAAGRPLVEWGSFICTGAPAPDRK